MLPYMSPGSVPRDLTLGGPVRFGDGVAANNRVFLGTGNMGIADGGANFLILWPNHPTLAALAVRYDTTMLRDSARLSWGNQTTFATSLDLYRDADDTFAQRRGTNPQASGVYETYTDVSNYSRIRIDASKLTSGVFRITSEAAGTGTKRPIAIDGYSKSGAPTAAELPAGTSGVFKDTVTGDVVLAYNDGGTIKTVTLT